MVVSTFAMRRKWTIANKTLGLVVCCMWLRSTKIVHAALAIPRANLTTIPLAGGGTDSCSYGRMPPYLYPSCLSHPSGGIL